MRIVSPILILLSAALTGCVPWPHTTERFPATSGRVVDAVTGRPVGGVVIWVDDNANLRTTTDTNGGFHFPEIRNHHFGYFLGICSTDWPAAVTWSRILLLSHPEYLPLRINLTGWDRHPQTNDSGDIILKPKPR